MLVNILLFQHYPYQICNLLFSKLCRYNRHRPIDELQEVNPNTAEDCSFNHNEVNNQENPERNNIAEEFNYHKIKNDVRIEISKDGTSTKKQWCYYHNA